MGNIIAIVIALLVSGFVVYPIIVKRRSEPLVPGAENSGAQEDLELLETQKESLYAAIKEIEFDHGLGKLSTKDYNELNQKYKSQAAALLKKIDAVINEVESDELGKELEREITGTEDPSISENTGPSGKESVSAPSTESSRNCYNCGRDYSAEDKFCSGCGVMLQS